MASHCHIIVPGVEPHANIPLQLKTISCLLIHPNPDSALNSAAGALLQDDYEAFAHHAKLMASIHAPIPKDIRDVVMGAKRRGEDPQKVIIFEGNNVSSLAKQSVATGIRVITKKRSDQHQEESFPPEGSLGSLGYGPESRDIASGADASDAEYDDPAIASKENDPSLSPSPVAPVPPGPRKSILGKRPLSVLATAFDPDTVMLDTDGRVFDGMTASEKNIAANSDDAAQPSSYSTPRKSPKLSQWHKSVTLPNEMFNNVGNGDNSSSSSGNRRTRPLLESIPSFQDGESQLRIYEDNHESLALHRRPNDDGKENFKSQTGLKEAGIILMRKPTAGLSISSKAPTISQATSKISKSVAIRKAPSAVKSKPRIGVRRL